MKPISLTLSVACCAAVATLVAQSPMRAGQWEVTTQMEMAGAQMPPMKATQCVTPEQLKNPEAALPTGPNQAGCKMSDYKITDNKVSWKTTCSQGMSGTGEIAFEGDTYQGVMKMAMPPQGEMTMKLSGKRTGDCTK
jgi:hypothetical protein